MDKIKRYLYRAFELLLIFIIFFCPLAVFTAASDPFWVVEKFFLKFSVSLLGIIFAAYCYAGKEYPRFKTPYNIAFLIFIGANILGLIGIPNIYAFLDRFFLNLCYLILFYLTLYYIEKGSGENYKKVLAAALLGGFVTACYGLMQSAGIDFVSWRSTYSGRAASTLGNPDFLAGHMLLLIPPALALLIATKKPLNRFLFFILVVVLAGAMLASQTRGAYIGFIVSIIVFMALFIAYEKKTFKKFKKAAVIAAVLLAIGLWLYFASNQQAVQRMKDAASFNDDAGRIRAALWKNSAYLIKDHFFTGAGPGNFYITYSFYQSKSLSPDLFKSNEYYKSGHAHNDFIQFMAEYGVFGAGAMYLFLFLIFFTAVKFLKKQEGDRMTVIGITAGISGIMAHAVFNFPFQIVPTMAVFYVFTAVALSRQGNALVENGRPGLKYFYAASAVILLIAAGISARALAADAYLRKAKESEYFKQNYDAVNYASDAVELNPWNDEYAYFYAKSLEENNNPEKAFGVYRLACALNPGHWEALCALFNMYAAKNDAKGMVDISEKMYRISPYAMKAITAMAFSFYVSAKYDEAIRVYEEGIKVKGESPALLSQLGAVYGSKGNVSMAMDLEEKAVRLDPGFTDAYYNLAVINYRMGKKGDAVMYLKKILKLQPGDEKASGFIKVIQNAGKK